MSDLVLDDPQVVAAKPPPAATPTPEPRPDPVTIEDGAPGLDPAEEVARAAREAAAADQRAQAAERRAQQADQQRRAAEERAQQADAAAATGRTATVAAAVEAATADRASALAAYRAAREAGDIDAEVAAQDKLAAASSRLQQSQAELEWLKANGQPQRTQAQPRGAPQSQFTPETQAWVDAHPRFAVGQDGRPVDPAYYSAAVAAHGDAIKRYAVDTPEYFRYLDQRLEQQFGNGGHQMPADNRMTGPQDTRSTAAPPTGGGGGSATRLVRTPVGTMRVNRRSDGRLGIDRRDITPDMEDAARWSGMSLPEWCHEQIKIADEMAAGGDGGWRRGEGEVLR